MKTSPHFFAYSRVGTAFSQIRKNWQAISCYGLLLASVCSQSISNLFFMIVLTGALGTWAKQAWMLKNSKTVNQSVLRPQWMEWPWWLWGALWAYPLILTSTQFFSPSIPENLDWMSDQWYWLLILALVPFLRQVKLERMLRVYAVAIALIALYGVCQYYWGWDFTRSSEQRIVIVGQFEGSKFFHAHGTFSHHLTYAGFLLMPLGLFSCLYFGEKRWWWLLGTVAAGLGILFSLSRIAWLSSWFLIFPLLRRFSLFWRMMFLAVSLVAFLLLMAGYQRGGLLKMLPLPLQQQLMANLDHLPSPVYRILDSHKDTNPRARLWQIAWHGIKQQPWLGRGLNPKHFHRYREQFDAQTNLSSYAYGTLNPHAHNIYLQIWFGSGLVGLIALLGWWMAIFGWGGYVLWQTRSKPEDFEKNVFRGCLAALVSQAVFGLFQNNLSDNEVLIATIIFVSLLLHCGLKLLEQKDSRKLTRQC